MSRDGDEPAHKDPNSNFSREKRRIPNSAKPNLRETGQSCASIRFLKRSLVWNPRSAAIAAFLVSLLYAVLRYHVAKGVEWSHLPLWTTNKALAVASVGLVCASYWCSRLGKPSEWPRWLGLTGFALLSLHSIASLVLFSPGNYAKFFVASGMTLNFVGELSMMFGVTALGCFSCAAISSLPGVKNLITKEDWLKWQKVGVSGLYLTLGHVVVMGANVDWKHWLLPSEWPTLGIVPLPSITLISCILILPTLIFRLRSGASSARKEDYDSQ